MRAIKADKSHRLRSGFTLIELSIVLAIIGLLAGGIMWGKSLLRQSQVNSILTDQQKYAAAIKQFIVKYGQNPGDFTGATGYWGIAGGTVGTNYTTDCYASGSATSPATCNGNGDGQLGTGAAYYNETLRVWQHLANAKMIPGAYTGTGTGNALKYEHTAITNAPASIDGASFYYYFVGTLGSVGYAFEGVYGNMLGVGAFRTNTIPVNPFITAIEAQSLDNKADDGKPAYGNIRSWKNAVWDNLQCATTTSPTTAVYNTTVSGNLCTLIFIIGN